MATKPNSKTLTETVTPVKVGSKQHENLLEAGYHITKAQAQQIIKEREANPLSHPYERYQDALAFLKALETAPVPIDTDPGWKRTKA